MACAHQRQCSPTSLKYSCSAGPLGPLARTQCTHRYWYNGVHSCLPPSTAAIPYTGTCRQHGRALERRNTTKLFPHKHTAPSPPSPHVFHACPKPHAKKPCKSLLPIAPVLALSRGARPSFNTPSVLLPLAHDIACLLHSRHPTWGNTTVHGAVSPAAGFQLPGPAYVIRYMMPNAKKRTLFRMHEHFHFTLNSLARAKCTVCVQPYSRVRAFLTNNLHACTAALTVPLPHGTPSLRRTTSIQGLVPLPHAHTPTSTPVQQYGCACFMLSQSLVRESRATASYHIIAPVLVLSIGDCPIINTPSALRRHLS